MWRAICNRCGVVYTAPGRKKVEEEASWHERSHRGNINVRVEQEETHGKYQGTPTKQ